MWFKSLLETLNLAELNSSKENNNNVSYIISKQWGFSLSAAYPLAQSFKLRAHEGSFKKSLSSL